MFTVIIPLFNKAPYVAKALQSVASQTFQEFELIVIDDGSTDKSFEIAQQVLTALTPPLGGWVALQQQNQGVSTTRNNGVKSAKYNYISFLDADDWWEPTFLEEMKALIDEFPTAGIYGSSYYKVKYGKSIQANIGVEPNFDKGIVDYFNVYKKTMWMPLWTGAVIIPKSIFNEFNGFKTSLKLGEDFHLWSRIAGKYDVAMLNKPLAFYNQDVDIINRAIDGKLYNADEFFLFAQFDNLFENKNFRTLYESLAVYSLLPYYLSQKNKKETTSILTSIDWKKQPIKYRIYYKVLPLKLLKFWYKTLKLGSIIKQKLKGKL